MKLLILFGTITAIFFLISCRKDISSGENGDLSIIGKWNIITDSTFTGVGIGNHPVNYTAQNGDYFDFRVDGNVYVKEGAALDTLSYTLTSGSTIVIESFGITLNGVPETSYITYLTSHTAIITAPDIITPGGIFGRKISLKR